MEHSQWLIDTGAGQSASQQEGDELKGGHDEMRGNQLDKVSQSRNSATLLLSQRFKHSEPVLVIETNMWAKLWYPRFDPSCLRRSCDGANLLMAGSALCGEIKRAEQSWNPIRESKPQAALPFVTTAPVYSAAHTGGELREKSSSSFLQPLLRQSKNQTQDECSYTHRRTQKYTHFSSCPVLPIIHSWDNALNWREITKDSQWCMISTETSLICWGGSWIVWVNCVGAEKQGGPRLLRTGAGHPWLIQRKSEMLKTWHNHP